MAPTFVKLMMEDKVIPALLVSHRKSKGQFVPFDRPACTNQPFKGLAQAILCQASPSPG